MVRAPFWRKFATTYERTSGWDLLRVGQLSLVVYSSGAVFSSPFFPLFPFVFSFHFRAVYSSGAVFFPLFFSFSSLT